MKLAYPLLNAFMHQSVWLITALCATNSLGAYALLVALAQAGWHVRHSGRSRQEIYLLLGVMLIGLMLEQAILSMGWIRFAGAGASADWVPIWMAGIWLSFATTFNGALRWLAGRTGLATILGLTGGPLAYQAAAGIGVLVLIDPVRACMAYSIAFGLIVPLAVRAAAFARTTSNRGSVS